MSSLIIDKWINDDSYSRGPEGYYRQPANFEPVRQQVAPDGDMLAPKRPRLMDIKTEIDNKGRGRHGTIPEQRVAQSVSQPEIKKVIMID